MELRFVSSVPSHDFCMFATLGPRQRGFRDKGLDKIKITKLKAQEAGPAQARPLHGSV